MDFFNYHTPKTQAQSAWVYDEAVSNGLVKNDTHKYIRHRVHINSKNDINSKNEDDIDEKCEQIDQIVDNSLEKVKALTQNQTDCAQIFTIVRNFIQNIQSIIADHHDPYYDNEMDQISMELRLQLYECEHGAVQKMLSQDPSQNQHGKNHLIEIIEKYAESMKSLLERFRKIPLKSPAFSVQQTSAYFHSSSAIAPCARTCRHVQHTSGNHDQHTHHGHAQTTRGGRPQNRHPPKHMHHDHVGT